MTEETIKKVNEEELRKMFRERIPFKIKVTPELSEKIQTIGFEERVRWANGKKEVFHTGEPGLCFDRDYVFTYFSEIDGFFHSQKEQEICLIGTKEEKPFFSSQEEIWKYLTEEEGRKVQTVSDSTIVIGFTEKGVLWDYGEDRLSYMVFEFPGSWKPYIDKPWYEDIPPQGILCWVGDSLYAVNQKIWLRKVLKYFGAAPFPFEIDSYGEYMYAIPATKEEVENLIWKEKE